ncbi:MAG: Gfo/Idh/MocA family oxidoreductase, partial [Ignavibacteria bacterium]|nr:Gfo/Idh/MocA family oxidoreductase [Ignavibacteria bacterium]
MGKITAIVIGAGDRGFTYSRLGNQRITPVIVCETRLDRRRKFADEFSIPPERQFENFQDVLNKKSADLCIITTPDELHYEPAKMAIEAGYDILLEKPICNDKQGIIKLLELNKKYKRFIGICHVLRYAPFYKKLKEILNSSAIGEVITI